jgi:hypothetical protein
MCWIAPIYAFHPAFQVAVRCKDLENDCDQDQDDDQRPKPDGDVATHVTLPTFVTPV